MNIEDALISPNLRDGDSVELSGWLVDTEDGLYIFSDHYPENYAHPYRMKICNGDIIYPILSKVPSLAGGSSLLFYKAKAQGKLTGQRPFGVELGKISIESNRGSGLYGEIDIRQEIVDEHVRLHGSYKFDVSRKSMRDWLDDE